MRLLILALLLCLRTLLAHDRIIFHHIPKTGGITIRNLLMYQFPQEKKLCDYHYYKFDQTKQKNFEPYLFIHGHIFYFQLKDLPGKRITFLRDPVQLVLSASQYKKQSYSNQDELFSRRHCIPEGDPLESMTNHQCHFLSSYDSRNKSISERQHLESAKINLHKFFFVGITEELKEGAPILFKMLGMKPLTKVPKANQTYHATYAPELLEKIRKRNWADIELYNYAKKLYIERFKRTNQETS